MRKLVTLGIVLVVLGGAILLAPAFVPWNQFRTQVAELLGGVTGRQVVIDGDLGLSLLPVPTLTADNVRLLDGDAPAASVDRIALEVQPWPLISGTVEFKTIRLDTARLRIREDADGRRHWPIALGAFGRSVHIESLTFNDATLSWERPDRPTVRIEAIQGEVTAGGAQGPFEAQASGMINDVPLKLNAAAGRRAANGTTPLRLTLSLPTGKGEVRFAGIAAASNGIRRYEGDLTAQAVDSTPLLSLLWPLTGLAALPDRPLGRALTLSGRLQAGPERLMLDGIDLKLGDSSATGSLDLPLQPGQAGSLVLAAALLDVEVLRDTAAPLTGWSSVPTMDIDLLADQIRWRGDMLHDVQLRGQVTDKLMRAETASAVLPGATRLSLSGDLDLREEAPRIDADITVNGIALRDSLAWAGVDVASVPLERLRHVELKGHLAGKRQDFAVTGLQGTLDTTRVDGDVRVTAGDRTGLGMRLTIDRLDLDAYRTGNSPPWQEQLASLLDTHNLNLELVAGHLTAAGLHAEGLALTLDAEDGAVTLHQVEVKALSGVALRASGRYAGKGPGSSHLTLTASAPSLGPAFQALELASPLAADRLGAVTLEARIVGDAAKAALDIRFGLLGGTLHIGGDVLTPGDTPIPALKLRATIPETMDLLRVAAPGIAFPAGTTGPLDLYAELGRTTEGAFTLSGLQGSFGGAPLTGSVQWQRSGGPEGTPDAPVLVDGNLAFGLLDIDRLLPMLTRENGETGLGFTQSLGGRIAMTADRLILAGEMVEQVGFTLQAARGQIRLGNGTGTWQGGRLALEAGIDQMAAAPEEPVPPLTGNLTLSLTGANLPAATPPAGNGLGVRGGKIDLQFTGTAAGANTRQLWSALSGTGKVMFHSGTLAGLDLGAMTKRIGQAGTTGPSLRTLALRGGSTGFETLEWDFTLTDQLAALSGIRFASAAATAAGTGVWQLRSGTVDIDLQVIPAVAGTPPPFQLRLAGPIGAPKPQLETAALEAWQKARSPKPAPAASAPPSPPVATTPAPNAKPAASPRPADSNPVSGILDRLKKGG